MRGENIVKRCGFVTVLGVPNSGKSTIVNSLVGTKVSIVSPKVQTTRIRIRGIYVYEKSQVILSDTPGIFKPKRRLDRAMVSAAWDEVEGSELVMLIVDANKGFTEGTREIISTLCSKSQDTILVFNKIDIISNRNELLRLTKEATTYSIFKDIFMVSAQTGECIEDLKKFLAHQVPEGPWLFPEDEVSDLPLRMLSAEITREKIFQFLHEELPYSITVETKTWEEKEDGTVSIEQTIFVERDSQRKIVLGHKGQKIKTIGMSSRKEIEAAVGKKVHLFLFVKVSEDWENDPHRYRNLGLDFNA